MVDTPGPSTLQKRPRAEPLSQADTGPVQWLSTSSDYQSGHLQQGRKAVLQHLRRYLRVPYSNLIHSVLGDASDDDISEVSGKLKADGLLDTSTSDGMQFWTGFGPGTTPSKIKSGRKEQIFQGFVDIVSKIFSGIGDCQLSCMAQPSKELLSDRGETSRSDAYIAFSGDLKPDEEMHWINVAIPFEFKKKKDAGSIRNNEEQMIWNLHHIMREDPRRRFVLGITIEDMDLRVWYSNRAYLAASTPIDFVTGIKDIISLFCLIGNKSQVELGWDPTVGHISSTTYEFVVGGRTYTTRQPLSTIGADVIVGRASRVYEAEDNNGKTVVIKDSWRDEDRELEKTILDRILDDIRRDLGDEAAKEAEKYFVNIRISEDVVISGQRVDKTIVLVGEGDTQDWITIGINPTLPKKVYSSGVSAIPQEQLHFPTPSWGDTQPDLHMPFPCRVHTRTVYEEVGTPVAQVTPLLDSLNCLSGVLRALNFMHRAGWVHRDISVTNALWVQLKDDQLIGKLTDLEYAKKVSSESLHDVRTGTIQFMAVEVESKNYLFTPETLPFSSDPLSRPPFRMNFLHDLESLLWCSMWILLFHTDANSPTESPEPQQKQLHVAFPGLHDERSQWPMFLFKQNMLQTALSTLSTTYRDKVFTIFGLGFSLQEFYERAEQSFPVLSLNEALLQDAHKKVSDALVDAINKLKGSGVLLQPLHQYMEQISKTEIGPAEKRLKVA